MTPVQRWTAEVAGWIGIAPHAVGDLVFVRAAGDLVALDPADGDVHWSTGVDAAGGQGELLVVIGDVIVTTRHENHATVLIGVHRDGRPAWERATGLVIADAWAVVDGDFVAFGHHETGAGFIRLHTAGGEIKHRQGVELKPDTIDVGIDGLVGTRRVAPGLLDYDVDGTLRASLREEPVHARVASDARTWTIVDHDGGCRLEADVEGTLAWSRAVANGALAVADADVAVVDAADDGPHTVLLDASDGSERWRSAPLAEMPWRIDLLSDVVSLSEPANLRILARNGGRELSAHLMGTAAVPVDGGYIVTSMSTVSCFDTGDGEG